MVVTAPDREGEPPETSERPARRRLRWLPRPGWVVGPVWRVLAGRPILLVLVVGLVATGATVATTESVAWMETPQFCGQCHTMGPEVAAHERSTHETVECGECHVGKGLVGLAKAKIGGMRQMIALIAGDYAKPIAPAAHSMPPASETCGRCHDPAAQRGDKLITRSHFLDDARNSEQQVALVVRLGTSSGQTQGIHWHVQSKVSYVRSGAETEAKSEGSEEAGTGPIAWVGVEKQDGTREEFVAKSALNISSQAAQTVADLKTSGAVRVMNCYDCHNRIGHDFPSVGKAIDQALSDRRLDRDIPYIRKQGVATVSKQYGSAGEADAAVRSLRASYHASDPYLWLDRPESLERSFAVLSEIYRDSDHPEMNVTPADYPNQLGHTESTGCFRCHDGGHNKVVDGRLTDETIPSTCSTCHTFPSVGDRAAIPLGLAPTSHAKSLWVFDHKNDPQASDPSKSTCSACHSQSYCSNCHASGAKLVKHDEMRFDHAAVIRKTGQQACDYCHQKPFCARCHAQGTGK